MSEPAGVLVVDASTAFRHAYHRVFSAMDAYTLVSAVPSVKLAQHVLKTRAVDVLLVDASPEGGTAAELVAYAAAQHTCETVVMAPAHGQSWPTVQNACAQGARLMHKPTRPDSTFEAALAAAAPLVPTRSIHARTELVAIGASTGGPQAVARLLEGLRANVQLPIIITQHMSEGHHEYYVETLQHHSRHPVSLATDGEVLEPGHVYVAGPERHLEVARARGQLTAKLSAAPAVHFCRPAVDPMLKSVARVLGHHALAVVLTGMGHDGADGAGAIRAAGGKVAVQDKASSVVWGMPGHVLEIAGADFVGPVDQIVEWILRMSK